VTLPSLRKTDDITLRIQHDARERKEKVGIHRELKIVCSKGTTLPEQYRTQTADFELSSRFCEHLIKEVTGFLGEVFTLAW
jgi:hypothetical protein